MIRKLARMCGKRKTDLLLAGIVLLLAIHSIYCFSFSDSRMAFAFASITTLFATLVYVVSRFLQRKGKFRIETMFLIAVIGCGLFYSAVFAPGTVPDESYHFQASYNLADQIMFLNPTTESLPMRGDDIVLLGGMEQSQTIDYSKYHMLASQFSLFVGQGEYASIVPRSAFDWGSNPPYIKLPSALGIVVASVFNLGSYPLFYLGRFFNLLLFAVLAYFAVKITPVGKNAMMVAGLLPMTLHVASSYSYDAGIIGLAFLLTAMCFRAIFEKGLMSRRQKIALVLVAVLLAPCKVVYTVLVLLVLLIPRERFESARASKKYKACVIACCFLAIAILRAATLVQMAGFDAGSSPDVVNRGEEQGQFYSLSSLLADPLNAVLLFLRTFDSMGPFYLDTLVGGSLGWFQAEIHAPLFITLPLFFLVVLSAQRTKDDSMVLPGSQRFVFGGLAAVGWLGVMLSMVVGWTFTTELVIQGVQGRYFLPLLPMAVMALRSRHLAIDVPIDTWLVYGLVAINAAYLARVFSIAVGV